MKTTEQARLAWDPRVPSVAPRPSRWAPQEPAEEVRRQDRSNSSRDEYPPEHLTATYWG